MVYIDPYHDHKYLRYHETYVPYHENFWHRICLAKVSPHGSCIIAIGFVLSSASTSIGKADSSFELRPSLIKTCSNFFCFANLANLVSECHQSALCVFSKSTQHIWGKNLYTGCIKKMIHSDFSLKSVPGVGFYLFRGVLEPEFRAWTIWAL